MYTKCNPCSESDVRAEAAPDSSESGLGLTCHPSAGNTDTVTQEESGKEVQISDIGEGGMVWLKNDAVDISEALV